jgi:hypothetical protein
MKKEVSNGAASNAPAATPKKAAGKVFLPKARWRAVALSSVGSTLQNCGNNGSFFQDLRGENGAFIVFLVEL